MLRLKPVSLSDDDLQKILSDAKEKLEQTENSEIMKTLVQSFANVAAWKPKLFEPHFQVWDKSSPLNCFFLILHSKFFIAALYHQILPL